jgi:hypothetical protein
MKQGVQLRSLSDKQPIQANDKNCVEAEYTAVPTWEVSVAWTLRLVIFITGLYHLWTGEWLYVLYCAAGIGITVSVSLHSHSFRAILPIELELVLLWWLIGDMTLGRVYGLYGTSGWFDKGLHLINPLMLSWLAFLALYALHATGRLLVSTGLLVGATIMLTLGIGALWEIGEYLSDLAFGLGAQGSPVMDPLDDTMVDLMFDAAGGAIGGIAGSLYARFSNRSRCRIQAIASARQCLNNVGSKTKTTPGRRPPAR